METKQKIIEASIKIFTNNGYLGSSTKAIAKEAGVSEMTLFRKFQTKQNLFESMLQYTLINELSDPGEINFNQTLYDFTLQLLHNRLTLISKHINLVRMIIQESLQGRLSEELDYIGIMSKKLSNLFLKYHQLQSVIEFEKISDNILGIVLHYAIVDYSVQYHTLPQSNQHEYLQKTLNVLKLTT